MDPYKLIREEPSPDGVVSNKVIPPEIVLQGSRGVADRSFYRKNSPLSGLSV